MMKERNEKMKKRVKHVKGELSKTIPNHYFISQKNKKLHDTPKIMPNKYNQQPR